MANDLRLIVIYKEEAIEVELDFQTPRQIFTHVDAARASVKAFGHRKGVRVTDGEKTYVVHQNTVERVKHQ